MEPDWWARCVGIFGVLLATYSVWLNARKSSTRLTVSPILQRVTDGETPPYLQVIRVVNKSDFAVEIVEVGSIFTDGSKKIIYERKLPSEGSPNPERLFVEAQSSHDFTPVYDVAVMSGLGYIRSCYVKTANGKMIEVSVTRSRKA